MKTSTYPPVEIVFFRTNKINSIRYSKSILSVMLHIFIGYCSLHFCGTGLCISCLSLHRSTSSSRSFGSCTFYPLTGSTGLKSCRLLVLQRDDLFGDLIRHNELIQAAGRSGTKDQVPRTKDLASVLTISPSPRFHGAMLCNETVVF